MIAGVLIGGEGRRMGGAAKGLLVREGRTIVARWAAIFDALGVARVLVGRSDAYAGEGWRAIADAEGAEGPLAGVIALLEEARGDAIVVACDMPYVERALVAKLIAAPPAPIVAPRVDGRWQPLFGRYSPAALPVARAQARVGAMALQGLLDRAGAAELELDQGERAQLRDWDRPEEIER